MASGTSEIEGASLDPFYGEELGHYDEIALEPGEIAAAKAVVPEIQEQFKTCRCYFDEERNLVAIATEMWDEEKKMKHQLFKRLGRIKQTERRRNRGPRSSDATSSSPETSTLREGNSEDTRSTLVPMPVSEDVSSSLESGEALDSRPPIPPVFSTDPRLYCLGSGLKVWVYKGDILKIKVDTIVCPANKKLKRYGKLATAIAKAAGPELQKEKKEYIKRFKELKKKEIQCVTNAGKLDFKKIIHVEGPMWKHYKPHAEINVRECESDLFYAVYLSLVKAEELSNTSIGLPAIGAGNGKIPLEFCCVQYVQAVIDFSGLPGPDSSLKEVHFCDCNPDLVANLQKTFDTMVLKGTSTDYDRQAYVKTKK